MLASSLNVQVKLDKLVKPSKDVVDYRTDSTYISAKDLVGVACSLDEVQESLKKLLSHGTILVGHTLHNYLKEWTLSTHMLFELPVKPSNFIIACTIYWKEGSVAVLKLLAFDLTKLLLHKVSVEVPCQELQGVFSTKYEIDIQADVRVRGQYYSTFAVFKDAENTYSAFRGIEGQEIMDSSGRLQKNILLR